MARPKKTKLVPLPKVLYATLWDDENEKVGLEAVDDLIRIREGGPSESLNGQKRIGVYHLVEEITATATVTTDKPLPPYKE